MRNRTRSGGHSRSRCRCRAALRTISTAADEESWIAAPDNHFAVGPDSGVTESGTRCVIGACSCPAIGRGVVFPARIEIGDVDSVGGSRTTPDDHFAADPDGGVIGSAFWHVGSASSGPGGRNRIVSPTRIEEVSCLIAPAPANHFVARP